MSRVVASPAWIPKLVALALFFLSIIVLLLQRCSYFVSSAISNSPDLPVDKEIVNDVGMKLMNEKAQHSLSLNVPFIIEMLNSDTNTMTTCDPLKYDYVQLLLNDMAASSLHHRERTTSAIIESDYLQWKKQCWVDKPNNCYFWKKKIRIQIINHKVYVSSIQREMERHYYDKEGYRTGVLTYLCELQRKYAKYLPDTDFVLYYHDFKKKRLGEYNWRNNGSVPYFFTDYNLESNPSNLLLMTASRAYFKYRYFAAKDPILFNRYNVLRIRDYIDWMQTLKEINNTKQTQLLSWSGKTINKAMFRGTKSNGKARQSLNEALTTHPILGEKWKEYFDVELIDYSASYSVKRNQSLSIMQQLHYRFIIAMDGYSVRDGLLYQMEMGAVILKQMSSNVEWWYWNIRDGIEWIIFENVAHLSALVMRLVDTVNGESNDYEWNDGLSAGKEYTVEEMENITVNSKRFVDEYLSEENVDCFFINMLVIYNSFVFDVTSMDKSDDDYMLLLPPDLY